MVSTTRRAQTSSTPVPYATGADRLNVPSPPPISKFPFQLAGPQTNGVAFSGTNTLTAQDAYGNTVTGFNGLGDNVTVTRNAPLTGVVSGPARRNVLSSAADFVAGVADLGSLGLTYTGNAATGTLTATAQTGQSGTSNAVAVLAGAATKFVLTGSSSQTAGQAQQLTITAQDVSGNTATTYAGDKSVTFTGANAAGLNTPSATDKSNASSSSGARPRSPSPSASRPRAARSRSTRPRRPTSSRRREPSRPWAPTASTSSSRRQLRAPRTPSSPRARRA